MVKRLIATATLALTVALVTLASIAGPAGATPTSPGACHMLEANQNGIAGMDESHGGKNMVPLVLASLAAGCSP
jgi:hypothetical protein